MAKSSAAYARRNYWRGPVWINVNWFLVRGLERCGLEAEAAALGTRLSSSVTRSGFTEYYEPSTGAPLGSGSSPGARPSLDLLRDVRP